MKSTAFLSRGLLAAMNAGALAYPRLPTREPYWQAIDKIFVFGDSYTTTGFNATSGPQPSISNPLGNPEYPGHTSSNGPNWVDFLTTKYNQSLLLTYNLAYGGATVDSALVAQYLPTVLSLKQQVQQEFLPIYPRNGSIAPWSSSNTLFAIWIGINDVGNSYAATASGDTTIYARIISEYTFLINQLWAAGARNFLFLNVPPVDRSPLTFSSTASAQILEANRISLFNAGIASLVAYVAKKSSDVRTFLYDTHALFTQVLDNPQAYPQTALYKNTANYCFAYENGTASANTFNASCGYAVNEYFWLNSLHPTYPMHDLLASEVVAGWALTREERIMRQSRAKEHY